MSCHVVPEITGYTGNMKITLKLFFTLFELITFVVLVSLALARWSFQQRFFEFAEGLEQDRLS